MIYSFTEYEKVRLKRGGVIHVVTCPLTLPRNKLLETFKTVYINDELKNVTAVESFALVTISEGTRIGLLIEE